MNLLFIFGLVSATLYLKIINWNDRYRNTVGAIALILGSVGFIATMYIYGNLDVDANAWPYHVVTIWGFGISSLFLMLATVSREINRYSGKLRLMNLIGNASYSIYLVHSPFGKLAWNLLRPIHPLWQGEPKVWVANILLLWITLGAVSAGIIIHLKIELPLLKLLRAKVTGR